MLVHKKIQIPNYEETRKDFYQYIFKKYNGSYSEIVGYISKEEILEISPNLMNFFNELEIIPLYAALFIREPYVTGPIHIDNNSDELKCELAINLPIANCENIIMNWYSINTDQLHHINDRGSRYRALPVDTDWKTVPILDSTIIDEPTLLRIDIPHNVVNDQDKYRILISIRFDPQPTHLWPEEMTIWK